MPCRLTRHAEGSAAGLALIRVLTSCRCFRFRHRVRRAIKMPLYRAYAYACSYRFIYTLSFWRAELILPPHAMMPRLRRAGPISLLLRRY